MIRYAVNFSASHWARPKADELVKKIRENAQAESPESAQTSWAPRVVVTPKIWQSHILHVLQEAKCRHSARLVPNYTHRREHKLSWRVNIISTLDSNDGHWYVEFAKEERGKTVFASQYGLLQFAICRLDWKWRMVIFNVQCTSFFRASDACSLWCTWTTSSYFRKLKTTYKNQATCYEATPDDLSRPNWRI